VQSEIGLFSYQQRHWRELGPLWHTWPSVEPKLRIWIPVLRLGILHYSNCPSSRGRYCVLQGEIKIMVSGEGCLIRRRSQVCYLCCWLKIRHQLRAEWVY
jgi:hypothetical protein